MYSNANNVGYMYTSDPGDPYKFRLVQVSFATDKFLRKFGETSFQNADTYITGTYMRSATSFYFIGYSK